MDLTDVQLEIFMGSMNLFAMIGALCAQFISDGMGRRRAFQVSGFIFILGLFIMSTSINYSSLLFGRIFVGLGVGFGMAIDPIYISEISPASHRGQLVTFSEIAINVGITLGFSSGLVFAGISDAVAWRLMFASGAIMPIILIILVEFVMPESPRWLVVNDKDAEAAKVLAQIYPPNFPVGRIIEDIHETIQRERLAEHAVGWDIILNPSPAFRRMLIVGIGTSAAQQLVGVEAIQYYMLFIIRESGVEDETLQSLALIGLGILKLSTIVLAGFLFDATGRRPLILTSLLGMAIALLMQSFNFMADDTNGGFAIFALAVYLAFFSVGVGPGGWLIPSEVYSTCIRAKAMSLTTFTNRLIGTIMSSTFLSMANAITWAGYFLLLTFICISIAAFIYFLLPETKGHSLEDMSLYFAEITDDRSILDVDKEYSPSRQDYGVEMRQNPVSNLGTMT